MKREFAGIFSILLAVGCGGGVEPELAPTAIGDAGTDAPPLAPQTLALTGVDVYQTVQIPLMRDYAKVDTRKAPVIADRGAMFRVSVKPDVGWKRKKVTAKLHLESKAGAEDLVDTREIGPSGSLDSVLDSTFHWDLPREKVLLDTAWSVTVTNGEELLAQYPAEGGVDPLAPKTSGVLKVKIVPVKWDADGSGRVPSTTEDSINYYRDYLYSMYPVTGVEVTVREPWSWTEAVDPGGDGWDTLLSAIVDLRNADGAPADVYYYGLFKPADQFWKYCRMGCVAGLSGLLSDPTDAFSRGSIGLGYGEESAKTMAHEIGHAHGRAHAPCGGPAGIDKKFPYKDGSVGVYGWNLIEKTLMDTGYNDVMGYCDPNWISDYTYNALYSRVFYVNSKKSMVLPDGAPPIRYRFVHVQADGKLRWGKTTLTRNPPTSDPHTVTYEAADGTKRSLSGFYYPHADLGGGLLVVPEPISAAGPIRITVDGLPAGVDRVLTVPR